MRWFVGSRSSARAGVRNSLTAPYLWGMCALCVVPAWKKQGQMNIFLHWGVGSGHYKVVTPLINPEMFI